MNKISIYELKMIFHFDHRQGIKLVHILANRSNTAKTTDGVGSGIHYIPLMTKLDLPRQYHKS